MTNLQTLSSCWSLLLTVWSLSGEAARSAVLRHPALLSSRALDDIQARRKLLRRLGIAPGTDRCRRVIERFPQILYISVGFFLEANVEILSDYLGVGDLTEPISVFPQVQYRSLYEYHSAPRHHNPLVTFLSILLLTSPSNSRSSWGSIPLHWSEAVTLYCTC
jgi:hypothetical protein